MARLLFGRGARGGIIRSIQVRLRAGGYYTGTLDGQYGGGTQRGATAFQRAAGLPANGSIDDATWTSLMKQPVPALFERALQLTAAFEGHGFGMIQGNWDGAWLTWGIIGFTLKHGELTRILLNIATTHPAILSGAFGAQTPALLQALRAPLPQQEAWANTISEGATVKEPWRSGFRRLGGHPIVQAAQLERARTAYFAPAMRTAAAYGLSSERGLALCFDIHVQNGGINDAARAVILQGPAADEQARRIAIANAVADAAKTEFREDVRARKLTLASGTGTVHGELFATDRWGVGEYAAQELGQA